MVRSRTFRTGLLVTDLRRSLSLNLSDTGIYEPQIRARHRTAAYLGSPGGFRTPPPLDGTHQRSYSGLRRLGLRFGMCVHVEAKCTLLRNPPIGLRVSAKGGWVSRLGFMVYGSQFGVLVFDFGCQVGLRDQASGFEVEWIGLLR